MEIYFLISGFFSYASQTVFIPNCGAAFDGMMFMFEGGMGLEGSMIFESGRVVESSTLVGAVLENVTLEGTILGSEVVLRNIVLEGRGSTAVEGVVLGGGIKLAGGMITPGATLRREVV